VNNGGYTTNKKTHGFQNGPIIDKLLLGTQIYVNNVFMKTYFKENTMKMLFE
jgi:hypothetical protein